MIHDVYFAGCIIWLKSLTLSNLTLQNFTAVNLSDVFKSIKLHDTVAEKENNLMIKKLK